MFAAQARYNRINQFTPQGSLIFDEDPGGHATATMTHSPEQQSLIDAQNQMRMDAFGRLGSLLGFSPGRGAPPRVGTPDKPGKINDLVNQDGGAVIPMFASYVFATSDKIGHGDFGSNWDVDGQRWTERWWFN